jgi:hypothetical protein
MAGRPSWGYGTRRREASSHPCPSRPPATIEDCQCIIGMVSFS